MRAMILFTLLLIVNFGRSFAAEATVTFDGDWFVKKYATASTADEFVLGFLPKTETQESWSKMVTYRYERLPGIGNDPKKAAQLMANTAKSLSTRAETRITTSGNEAILDSTNLTLDQKYIELNVYKFSKSTDGEAVVSVQVTYRVKVVVMPASWEDVARYKNGLDYVRSARTSWPNKVGSFDMRDIEAELTKAMQNPAINLDAMR